MTSKRIYLLIVVILLLDQVSKIYVKTHFQLYEDVKVLSWFGRL